MGIRNWVPLVASLLSTVAGAALTLLPTRLWQVRRAIVSSLGVLGIVGASRFAGPFLVVPLLAMGLAVGLILFPRKQPVWVAIATGWAAVLGPLVLELAGVLPASYEMLGDRMCIPAQMVSFPPGPTLAYLAVVTALPIAAVCVYTGRMRDRLVTAEERLRIQAWQLRQILPEGQEAPPPSTMG
jgi:hypothetical protein